MEDDVDVLIKGIELVYLPSLLRCSAARARGNSNTRLSLLGALLSLLGCFAITVGCSPYGCSAASGCYGARACGNSKYLREYCLWVLCSAASGYSAARARDNSNTRGGFDFGIYTYHIYNMLYIILL